MDRALLERVISAVEPHVRSRCSPLEFEMAYQTRVAIDRIRFAIKQTEQFANCSPQAREAAFQLLDALDRLEAIDRRFQSRSRLHDLPSTTDGMGPESQGYQMAKQQTG